MKIFANWKNNFYKHSVVFFSFSLCLQIFGQDIDSEISKFNPFIQALQSFSKNIPQEKVYLHFDNTSYYQGDHIWFKCYIVTSGQHQLSDLSKTLYVELLNPGGEIVDKRILKIENGQCHGEFTMNHLPFYSGFYEVRAYTKYMLNFGDDVIFSRLLPVFDKPKAEGNFGEKDMMRYGRWGTGSYPMKREPPLRGNRVNLRFYPEGGNLVQGVASRVAFEATDEVGNPIEVTGVVMDGAKQELCTITTLHEGRGVFTYTPTGAAGRQKDIAEVEYFGRKYQFDLPAALPQGVVMEVDNLSHPDSMGIAFRKNGNTPAEMLGVAVLSGGKLQNYFFAWTVDEEISYKMDKTRLSSGVSQIVLFDSKGEILCDRLIFNGNNDFFDIKVKTEKPAYRPHELVNMEFSVTDREANPVNTTFSLAVRDGANEVENHHNILTDLLLMSEIKGYVRNPSFYFEGKNDSIETRRATSLLDVLLMVQGWRRYSWKQMTDVETGHAPSLQIKYLPEQGIETNGRIIDTNLRGKQIPKSNVDVDLLLQKREAGDEIGGSFIETFVTDEQGRFSFVSDVPGRWNMILTAREKRKAKNYQILLDRVFTPEPKRYRYADLQISIAEQITENVNNEETADDRPEDDFETFLVAYNDSLSKLGIDEKIHHISEVTITAKRRTKEQDIFHNRSTSVAYYDVASEMDDIYDRGTFVGNDIHELLANMNESFIIRHGSTVDFLLYKGKETLFVVNYKRVSFDSFNFFAYKTVSLPAIKSIYINEDKTVMSQYVYDPKERVPPIEIAEILGCAVFIETYPEGEIPVDGAKGVRKTWLEGYSAAKEFYSPNYSELPPQPDYRRTLYWNPVVTSDENGKAKINFYNNSSCTNFSISAETVTPDGMIGIYNGK